jgi:hypothetical protein
MTMNDKKILFINSYQRSGSTLLGMLLDYHPEITYLGEVRNVHEYLEDNKTDFTGELLGECEFWRAVFAQLPDDPRMIFTKVKNDGRGHNYSVRLSNFFDVPFVDKILTWSSPRFCRELQAHENIRQYYDAASQVTDATWIVDSSHRTNEAKSHVQALGHDMRIVFLTRDGRGVVNSVMKRTGEKIDTAARQWKRFILGARNFHARLADKQHLIVKYEDLCVDLLKEMDRMADFLHIEQFDQQLAQKQMTHHFVGGSSTLRDRKNQELAIRLDEKWRDTMRSKDLAVFEKIAGDVNRSLGYGN